MGAQVATAVMAALVAARRAQGAAAEPQEMVRGVAAMAERGGGREGAHPMRGDAEGGRAIPLQSEGGVAPASRAGPERQGLRPACRLYELKEVKHTRRNRKNRRTECQVSELRKRK